jgi:calcineurin-like phosphoesterase family protein
MTTWFTSDLHFGHANIIEYSRRPFRNVDDMNHALIERWNALVQPADTVWVLGDVAMGRIVDTLPLVSRLAGHKLLLAGNHDRCWSGHGTRAAEWIERYEDAGFEEIHQGSIALSVGGLDVLA